MAWRRSLGLALPLSSEMGPITSCIELSNTHPAMLELTDHVHCHVHKDDGDDDCRGYCDRRSCEYWR